MASTQSEQKNHLGVKKAIRTRPRSRNSELQAEEKQSSKSSKRSIKSSLLKENKDNVSG